MGLLGTAANAEYIQIELLPGGEIVAGMAKILDCFELPLEWRVKSWRYNAALSARSVSDTSTASDGPTRTMRLQHRPGRIVTDGRLLHDGDTIEFRALHEGEATAYLRS